MSNGSIRLITSFNTEGYNLYGRKFLESAKSFLSPDVELHVFLEEDEFDGAMWMEKEYPIILHDLTQDPDLRAFDQTYGWVDSTDYRYRASKFARKVFAITSPRLPVVGWRVWLDADTVFTGEFDYDWFSEVVYVGDLAYLGRKDWHHSECGFVAYNCDNSIVRGFLQVFRHIYTSGEVWCHQEWHDSYIFDRVREIFRGDPIQTLNLSKGGPGLHVWPNTRLAERLIHNKGNLKKS